MCESSIAPHCFQLTHSGGDLVVHLGERFRVKHRTEYWSNNQSNNFSLDNQDSTWSILQSKTISNSNTVLKIYSSVIN